MKSLAGANPDAKPDYRAQALNDLNKLEQKVILLNEMLDNVDRDRGERFVSGDAYDVSWSEQSPDSMNTYTFAFLIASCIHSQKCTSSTPKMDK